MADRPETDGNAQWRTAGDRIQTLLDSCAASGAAAYDRAQQLVREVVGLYGAGLERIVELSGDPGMPSGWPPTTWWPACSWCTACTRTACAGGSPMRWTGCGRTSVPTVVTSTCSRSSRTMPEKSPCDWPSPVVQSCPSSAVTLELAVEDAVRAAAPEVSSIEAVAAEPTTSAVSFPPNRCWRGCIRMARGPGIRCLN